MAGSVGHAGQVVRTPYLRSDARCSLDRTRCRDRNALQGFWCLWSGGSAECSRLSTCQPRRTFESWDPIPQKVPSTTSSWVTAAANAWSIMTVDLTRDLIFVPTG